jgi:hypothetical protein
MKRLARTRPGEGRVSRNNDNRSGLTDDSRPDAFASSRVVAFLRAPSLRTFCAAFPHLIHGNNFASWRQPLRTKTKPKTEN